MSKTNSQIHYTNPEEEIKILRNENNYLKQENKDLRTINTNWFKKCNKLQEQNDKHASLHGKGLNLAKKSKN